MDLPNAFIGRKTPPTEKEVVLVLGPSSSAWKDLLSWLKGQGIEDKEWHSVAPKYGWALHPELKKRRILYLGPREGCFCVSFVLGDKAVAAARASDLPKNVLKEIAGARRYAEGTGVHLWVKTAKDLAPIKKLVEIKLKN